MEAKTKVKVFISSSCDGDFRELRKNLKKKLEDTGFIEIYSFEESQASTMSAEEHYKLYLMRSNLCIFLIDNNEIPEGVQNELDLVKKHSIKAMYYFCNNTFKEKSALQLSLEGPGNPKYKEVEVFEDLLESSYQGLIDEISFIYEQYCLNRLILNIEDDRENIHIDYRDFENKFIIPSSTLGDSDQTKQYMHSLFLNDSFEIKNTCDLDKYSCLFLDVLLNQKSIEDYNISLLMKSIQQRQPQNYFEVVHSRWEYIQYYFLGEIDRCYEKAILTLELAKSKDIPKWIVKDILIDIRSIYQVINNAKNIFGHKNSAQKQLDELDADPLFYPVLDRIHESLNKKYLENNFKESIKSPNTITFGNVIKEYTDLIASSYIVTIFNGSLTHLILIHDQIKMLSFNFTQLYNIWELKLMLIKETVYSLSKKEIEGILNKFTDILSELNQDEALQIYEYCGNHVIIYKKLMAQLLSMKVVGYILSDDKFKEISMKLYDKIDNWIVDENKMVIVGQYIFEFLEGCFYRLSPDRVTVTCIKFINNNIRFFYQELFQFITQYLDINDISNTIAEELIQCLISLIDTEKDIHYLRDVVIKFRKQSREKTEQLDAKIKERMSEFYFNTYRLETTQKNKLDYPLLARKFIDDIIFRNENQGENGLYTGYTFSAHETLRLILKDSDGVLDENLTDSAFEASANTLLSNHQDIESKCDAIDLLISLTVLYPKTKNSNKNKVKDIVKSLELISTTDFSLFSNLNKESIQFSFCLLIDLWGEKSTNNIIQAILFSKDDLGSQIKMCESLNKYYKLENNLSKELSTILFQQVLLWSMSKNRKLKWNAIQVLFHYIRDKEHSEIIYNRIIHNFDNGDAYIKNLILGNIIEREDIITPSVLEYILSKSKKDSNYVVRKVYEKFYKERKLND